MALARTTFTATGGTGRTPYAITVEGDPPENGTFTAEVSVDRDGIGVIIEEFAVSAQVNGRPVDVSGGPIPGVFGTVDFPASPQDSVTMTFNPDFPNNGPVSLSFTVPGQPTRFNVSDLTEVACDVGVSGETLVAEGESTTVPVSVTFRNEGDARGQFSVGATLADDSGTTEQFRSEQSSEPLVLGPGEEATVELRFDVGLTGEQTEREVDVGYHIFDAQTVS
jgi:hypothetical protein